jgi:hypothetical protein
MRKRFQIVLALVLLALAGVMLLALMSVVVWQVLHPQEREPEYQQKPLSVWLSEYHEHFKTSMEEGVKARELAEDALRKIGTNAIPTLLKMAAKKDSLALKSVDPEAAARAGVK